jgi:hypothetical protein
MTQRVKREQQRLYAEQLLATDLSVADWCERNRINKRSMYNWLSGFADSEPELFGGTQNLVDRTQKRWLESTRKNMAASKALIPLHSPGIVIVDTLFEEPRPQRLPENTEDPNTSSSVIKVNAKGMSISIPAGTAHADISSVLKAVAEL